MPAESQLPIRSGAIGFVLLMCLLLFASRDAHGQLPIAQATTNSFGPRYAVQQVQAPRATIDPYQTVVPAQYSLLSPFGASRINGSGRSGRYWFRGEFLLWSLEDYPIPPLVTTSPAGTPLASGPGIIGEPGTAILVGGDIDYDAVPGGRLSGGFYFGPDGDNGIQFSVAGLSDDVKFQFSNPTILARPFFNVTPGSEGEDAEVISHPELADGQIRVTSDTDLYLFNLLFSRRICDDCCDWLELTAGYRYGSLEDCLLISDSRTVTSNLIPNVPIGTVFGEFDKFGTKNEFNGAELGVAWEGCRGPWSLELLMRLALGNTRSTVTIGGATTSTVPGGAPVVDPGGLLALSTNSGVFKRDNFSVIPELGTTLGYNINRWLQLSAGYTFIYWSDVARPGDQIDRNLNLTQLAGGTLVGPPSPQFRFVNSSFWAQGINFGAKLRF